MLDGTQSPPLFHRLGSLASLLLLLLLPAVGLRGVEFSVEEARCVQGHLGPLEHDERIAPPPEDASGVGPVLRAWAAFVGTTERPLRMLSLLILWLSAFIASEVARCRNGGLVSVSLVWLAYALSPAHGDGGDLVDPRLFGILPATLALGFCAWTRGGRPLWLLLPLAGFAAARALAPGAALGFVVAGALAFAWSWDHERPRLRWRGALALGFGLALWWLARDPEGELGVRDLELLVLPALSLLFAGFGRRGGGSLLIALILWLFVAVFTRNLPEAHGRPMRDLLDQARTESTPGGRLVVGGPLRQGLLFYSRRGHDPTLPLILVPEDCAPEELFTRLEQAVGSGRRAPEILVFGVPEAALAKLRIVGEAGPLLRVRVP